MPTQQLPGAVDVLWRQSPIAERRFFVWCYYVKRRDRADREFPSQIHKIRDGLALLTLSPALIDAGYRYGGAVLNIPEGPDQKNFSISTAAEYRPYDILLMNTRPPMDDPPEPRHEDRVVERSGYATETILFQALRDQVFEHCSRRRVRLRADLSAKTDPRATIFRDITFEIKRGGKISKLAGERTRPWMSRTPPGGRDLAAGYLVALPALGDRPFRLLAAFSSGGTESLWWSWLLMHQHRKILDAALRAREPKVWIGLFATPRKAPTFLAGDEQEFLFDPRKSDARWPQIIEWARA